MQSRLQFHKIFAAPTPCLVPLTAFPNVNLLSKKIIYLVTFVATVGYQSIGLFQEVVCYMSFWTKKKLVGHFVTLQNVLFYKNSKGNLQR